MNNSRRLIRTNVFGYDGPSRLICSINPIGIYFSSDYKRIHSISETASLDEFRWGTYFRILELTSIALTHELYDSNSSGDPRQLQIHILHTLSNLMVLRNNERIRHEKLQHHGNLRRCVAMLRAELLIYCRLADGSE